jgi:uncharacterized protein YndB with AHSA1/START domain
MSNNKTHSVFLKKFYTADKKTIYNLFVDKTVFKLTGADEIQVQPETGQPFHLTFYNRGIIYGHFILFTENAIAMEWNVEGFQRPKEINTFVEIFLSEENGKCHLTLHHQNIMDAAAAAAKQKAWTEILDDIEKLENQSS